MKSIIAYYMTVYVSVFLCMYIRSYVNGECVFLYIYSSINHSSKDSYFNAYQGI